MSIPLVVHILESSLDASSATSLDALIREHLQSAAREIGADKASPRDTSRESRASTISMANDTKPEMKTIISDLGDYLTQAAQILSCLTAKLVNGSHVDDTIMNAHEHADKGTDGADMSTIARMDVQRSRLRKIRDLADKFSRDVQDTWQPDPTAMAVDSPRLQTAFSPFRDGPRFAYTLPPIRMSDPDANNVHHGLPTISSSQPSYSPASPPANASGTDNSEDEDEQFSRIDMDALKQRGKGTYHCPLGQRCDKGGVDKEGNLVVFDRNSSFAQHCNKHRKPWRCDVPGCPNPPKKRKFARRDGLERHKATVKHVLVKCPAPTQVAAHTGALSPPTAHS